jgi:hypothetical protein
MIKNILKARFRKLRKTGSKTEKSLRAAGRYSFHHPSFF